MKKCQRTEITNICKRLNKCSINENILKSKRTMKKKGRNMRFFKKLKILNTTENNKSKK